MEKPFERLLVWHDPVARSGPENMAVDELLLESVGEDPVLRIYEWAGDWVSLGYFQRIEEARKLFAGEQVEYVRRMTGGGVVDHREDVTYSLIVPRGHALAEARGEESYRVIHAAVAEALRRVGVEARMLSEDDANQSAACFEKAVAWDVVDGDGRKIAGAGQKRNRAGLLHQGSVLGAVREGVGACFSDGSSIWEPRVDLEERVAEPSRRDYKSAAWLERR